jgi:hypothetical protein
MKSHVRSKARRDYIKEGSDIGRKQKLIAVWGSLHPSPPLSPSPPPPPPPHPHLLSLLPSTLLPPFLLDFPANLYPSLSLAPLPSPSPILTFSLSFFYYFPSSLFSVLSIFPPSFNLHSREMELEKTINLNKIV